MTIRKRKPRSEEVTIAAPEVGSLSEALGPSVAMEPPAEEASAHAGVEDVVRTTVLRTCVFCSEDHQVDLRELDGARIISEPELSVNHYICAGCNDAP